MQNSLIIGLLALILFTPGFAEEESDRPTQIADYFKTADIGIEGSITGIAKKHQFYGYDQGAAERQKMEQETGITMGVVATDYIIKIDDVLFTDTAHPYKKGDTVILRMFEEADIFANTYDNQPNGKAKSIFFLKRNSDNQTYGYYSNMHRIKITSENDISSIYHGQKTTPFGFKNHGAFVNEVKKSYAKN